MPLRQLPEQAVLGTHWAIGFDESRGRQAGVFVPPLGVRRFGLVLQMNGILPQRLHVRGWKTLMRVTLAGYWLVALLGFATYYFWFFQ